MYQTAIDFSKIHNVLVIKLRHHGDVLLTSPIYQILQQRFSHLSIDALIYKETQAMLADHDSINHIYCIDKKNKDLKFELKLLKQLKQQHYDLVIHLTESWRGAILTRLLKPRYSLVRRYPHRQQKLWINSFTHHYDSPRANQRHTVEMHLDALRRIGIHPHQQERKLILNLNTEAKQTLANHYPNYLDETYIVIHPTSRWLFKCYPQKQMAAVINQLSQQGYQIVVTAAPDEAELDYIGEMLAHVEYKITDLSGLLSLQELAVLLHYSQLYLGLDSVPMHMASALHVPTIALFGPSGEIEWGPWKNTSIVIHSEQHPCRPCGQDGCGNSKVSDCLVSLPVEEIVKAVSRIRSMN